MSSPPSTHLEQAQTSARVTMDVYSGRPNPEWNLSADQIAELRKRLSSPAAPAKSDAKVSDDLGYRSMQVLVKDANGENSITVSRGLVLQQIGANTKRHVDEQRALELWLLRTGEGTLSAELMQKTAAKISTK
jgi:hypothetical protein